MKKIVQAFLIFFFTVTTAQNTVNRFFYELTFRPNKDSLKTEKEMMILDLDKTQSVYQSYEFVVMDSILNDMVMKTKNSGFTPDFHELPDQKQGHFSHRIFKNYPVKEIIYKDRIFTSYFTYHENPEFNWNVTPEKQKIGAYDTQKATTYFAGRKWIAWFTTTIPIQDGPYKFYGLPGLIVKIEDEQKNFSWELMGNRKIDDIKDTLYIEDLQKSKDSKEITKEKFIENYDHYKKDPFAETRQMITKIPSGTTLPDGSSIHDGIREMEKKAKEAYNKYNNNIEIQQKKK